MQSRRRLCVSALLAHGPWYTLGGASALPSATACRPRPRQPAPSDAIPLAKGQNRRMRSRLFRWLQRLLCTHAQILEERSGKLLSIIVPLKAKVRPLWLHGNHRHRIATTTVRHGSHTYFAPGRLQTVPRYHRVLRTLTSARALALAPAPGHTLAGTHSRTPTRSIVPIALAGERAACGHVPAGGSAGHSRSAEGQEGQGSERREERCQGRDRASPSTPRDGDRAIQA